MALVVRSPRRSCAGTPSFCTVRVCSSPGQSLPLQSRVRQIPHHGENRPEEIRASNPRRLRNQGNEHRGGAFSNRHAEPSTTSILALGAVHRRDRRVRTGHPGFQRAMASERSSTSAPVPLTAGEYEGRVVQSRPERDRPSEVGAGRRHTTRSQVAKGCAAFAQGCRRSRRRNISTNRSMRAALVCGRFASWRRYRMA